MLNRLSRRERKMITAGAALLVVFMTFIFVFFPTLDKKNALEAMLIVKQNSLGEIIDLQRKYEAIVNKRNMLNRILVGRDTRFSLFSFLDSLARETRIKEKIAYMKPDSQRSDTKDYVVSIVKLKLDALSMKELVDFMFGIENSGNGVTIASLSLAKKAKEEKLDVVIQAETLIKGEGT